MFSSRTELKDKLASAEAEVTRLESEVAEVQSLNQTIADQAEQIVDLKDELESITKKHDEIVAEKADLETKLAEAESKSSPEALQALVTEEMAKCGHKPVEEIKDEQIQSGKKATRSEFESMDHVARNQFIKEGGKITE